MFVLVFTFFLFILNTVCCGLQGLTLLLRKKEDPFVFPGLMMIAHAFLSAWMFNVWWEMIP